MLRSTALGHPQSCQRKTGRDTDGHLYQVTSHTTGTSAEGEEEAAGVDQSTIRSLHTLLHSLNPLFQPSIYIITTHTTIYRQYRSLRSNVTRHTRTQALLLSSSTECDIGGTNVTDLGYGREITGSAIGLGSTASALWQLACGCFFGVSGRSKRGQEGHARYLCAEIPHFVCLAKLALNSDIYLTTVPNHAFKAVSNTLISSASIISYRYDDILALPEAKQTGVWKPTSRSRGDRTAQPSPTCSRPR